MHGRQSKTQPVGGTRYDRDLKRKRTNCFVRWRVHYGVTGTHTRHAGTTRSGFAPNRNSQHQCPRIASGQTPVGLSPKNRVPQSRHMSCAERSHRCRCRNLAGSPQPVEASVGQTAGPSAHWQVAVSAPNGKPVASGMPRYDQAAPCPITASARDRNPSPRAEAPRLHTPTSRLWTGFQCRADSVDRVGWLFTLGIAARAARNPARSAAKRKGTIRKSQAYERSLR